MPSFYVITSIIAFCVLIIILGGVYLYTTANPTSNQLFPPNAQKCPDGWKLENEICVLNTSTKINAGKLLDTAGKWQGNGTFPGPRFFNILATTTAPIVGSVPQTYVGFALNDPFFTSAATKTLTCIQKEWCINLGITWDGVSNFNGC